MELTNYQPLTVGEIIHPSNWPLSNFQALDEMRYFSNKYSWLADQISEVGHRILRPEKDLPTFNFPGWSEREILAAPFTEMIERETARLEEETHRNKWLETQWHEAQVNKFNHAYEGIQATIPKFADWSKPKEASWIDANTIYDPAYKVMAVVFSILAIKSLWANPAQRKYLIAELVGVTTLAAAGIISGDISFAASSPISTHIGTAMLLTYFPVKYVLMRAFGN